MERYAVVPSKGRVHELTRLLSSLEGQVDMCVVVDSGGHSGMDFPSWVARIAYPDAEFNISRAWNIGLRFIEALMWDDWEWDVAVLNDDVIVPPGWVDRMSQTLRSTGALIAYPDQFEQVEVPRVFSWGDPPRDITQRIVGYAHLIRGEARMAFDESMRWWYSDDDFEWSALRRGTTVLVPGSIVEHTSPNGWTNHDPALAEQAGLDRQTFINKWGRAPW